jgi:RNA polymerase sigma-70 factor (ECF subfamily)
MEKRAIRVFYVGHASMQISEHINRSDEELALIYFNTGDVNCVGALFERHMKTVFGVCLFYFRDRDIAQDGVMQIFEKLLFELRKTQTRSFRAWLSFVVRNHCLSEIRKNKGKYFVRESYLEFEMQEALLEEEERIESVSEEDMLHHLKEELPALKEKQRLCIELFYIREFSYQEVSDKTGFSLPEVKSYIQNGKRNLKLRIEQRMKNKKHAA